MKDGILAFLLLIFGVAIICVCAGTCTVWNYGSRVAERTIGPDAMISNYEWYEQQLKDIKAIEGQTRDAEQAVVDFKEANGKELAYDQRIELSRLQANVTGLRQARRKMVEDYNARASMVTRSMWKSGTLPYRIEE